MFLKVDNHHILQVECRPLTCCIVLIVRELRNVFTADGSVELIIYATNTRVTQCWFHAGLRRCPSVKTTSTTKWYVKLKGLNQAKIIKKNIFASQYDDMMYTCP